MQAERESIMTLIGIIAVFGIVDVCFNRLLRTTKEYIQSKLRGNLQCQYYAKLLTKDYHRLTSLGTGQIQSKMEKGIDAEVMMFIDTLTAIIAIGIRG
jgi:ABC-type multidrug transport system fused ATPase/permease subunit